MFDPEVMGDVFLIDRTQLDDDRLRGARPTDKPRRHAEGQIVACVHDLHPAAASRLSVRSFR